MASFQAKIGWKWPRKRLKYKLSFRLVPNRRVIENSKKVGKNFRKHHFFFLHLKPKWVEKGQERRKIKIIVPFRSYPTRNRKVQKIGKNFKKYRFGFI